MKVLLIQKMAGISGSEIYFMNILPELNKRGIQAEFCCVQHPDDVVANEKFVKHLQDHKVTCHIINSKHQVSLPLLWKLKNLIKKEGYDIVHTNLVHADFWGALLRSFTRMPFRLVSVKHGYLEKFQKEFGFDHTKLPHDLLYRVSRYANSKMDRSAAISEGLTTFLINGHLVKKDRIEVIHYGFDFNNKTNGVEKKQLYRYGPQQLIIVGRLLAVKQHHLVIEILPALLEKYPELKLVLVGAGELEEWLKKLTGEKGVSQAVVFTGFQSDIHKYIEDSDILLVPSSAEGFGVVILEGWHSKKPVIAFDVPAPNEIIDNGINGYLIKPFDTNELFSRICQLFNDPVLRHKMGHNGHRKLEEDFTMDSMAKKTISLYKKVL